MESPAVFSVNMNEYVRKSQFPPNFDFLFDWEGVVLSQPSPKYHSISWELWNSLPEAPKNVNPSDFARKRDLEYKETKKVDSFL